MMTDFAAELTKAEIAEGKLHKHLAYIGTDSPPLSPSEVGPVNNGFIFRQETPSAGWLIVHNLNAYPSITVQDTAGEEQLVIATWINLNELAVAFSEPTQGTAWLMTD
jgi:hypothetical protein